MNIFRRLFKLGESEVHSAIDKLENPIKLTEQGIRDLKADLQDTLRSLAEVKAAEIRMRKLGEEQKNLALDYERKAMMLLNKVKEGTLDPAQGESLAGEALARKEDCINKSTGAFRDAEAQRQMVAKLDQGISLLRTKVQTYENDLITLRARAKTATATRKINQQLSKLDSGGTIEMLERMKQKVEEEEVLAQSYGELLDAGASVDDQINKALKSGLGGAELPPGHDALQEMKKKMGLLPGSPA
jgi:phage shock protein A